MSSIGVRSPYFISDDDTNIAYGTLDIDIDGTLRYQITKDVIPGTTTVTIDISQLVRDYIQPAYFSGFTAANTGAVTVDYELNLFESDGTPSGKNPITGTLEAYDAYRYYYNGNNYVIPASGDLVTGLTLYYPEGQSGFLFKLTSDVLSKVDFNSSATSASTTTIVRYPCSRYQDYGVTFINKFGVHQQLWFTAKTTESITTNGSKYKRKYNALNGGANGDAHQVVDYNKNAKKQYTLNTEYINVDEEAFNSQIQELLLSEYVWIDDPELNIISVPVNVVTSSVQYKTSLNDRLVSYTIVFEQAFDLISTAR